MHKFKILHIAFFICLVGCEKLIDRKYPIWIENKSQSTVYFSVNENYPDTALPLKTTFVLDLKNGERKSIDSDEPWNNSFSEHFPSDTLSIFFISADIINNYEWEEIREQYKILERHEYSYQDLYNQDWTITYP